MDEEHDQPLMSHNSSQGLLALKLGLLPPNCGVLVCWTILKSFMGPRAPEVPVHSSVLQMARGSPLMVFHFT